jgi:hypothetical protein
MKPVDWVATALAIVGTFVLALIFPVVNSVWGILVFFVLAGLFGGILRIARGNLRR